MRVLVTGATGYVGGRLVPQLLEAGHDVRAMTRTKDWLRDAPWADRVEIVTADLLDPATVDAAVAGIDIAYYLVHSIGTGGRFDDRDRAAAGTFGAAAKRAGVRRIIYLGGLSDETAPLSKHLASRAEVGRILAGSGVDTIVLRAAMIIGSGSASFEMMRYLTERLPAMVTPKWVRTRVQPIAITDVLRYLVGCATLPPDAAGSYDIGGPDVLTYRDIIARYAAVAGLSRRVIVPVPVLGLRLSSLWVGFVTPIPSRLARPLVDSLRTEVVCREAGIKRWLPDPSEGLLGFDEAVRMALRKVREAQVETRWSETEWAGAPSDRLDSDPDWAGGTLFVDERTRVLRVDPARAWPVVERLGGDTGWYSWRAAWAARGALDRIVGGVGLRRGRRDPARLRIGDAVDFWRVEEIVPNSLLRLRAEMRLPGRAWLEFRLDPHPGGGRLIQRAVFCPRGLLGQLYWYAIVPFHAPVFGGMVRNLAAAAEARSAEL